MRVSVLKFNEPNCNNRIYTQSETKFPFEGVISFDYSEDVTKDAVAGSFKNMAVEGNELKCDIDLTSHLAKSLFDKKVISIVTSGTGRIEDQDGYGGYLVTEAIITSLILTDNPKPN